MSRWLENDIGRYKGRVQLEEPHSESEQFNYPSNRTRLVLGDRPEGIQNAQQLRPRSEAFCPTYVKLPNLSLNLLGAPHSLRKVIGCQILSWSYKLLKAERFFSESCPSRSITSEK